MELTEFYASLKNDVSKYTTVSHEDVNFICIN